MRPQMVVVQRAPCQWNCIVQFRMLISYKVTRTIPTALVQLAQGVLCFLLLSEVSDRLMTEVSLGREGTFSSKHCKAKVPTTFVPCRTPTLSTTVHITDVT